MLDKINFSGFNYIHYKTADKQQIQADSKKLKDFIKKNKLEKLAIVDVCTSGKTIGIVTKTGNPYVDLTLLSLINKDLEKQYMRKTTVDLFV